MIQTHAITGAIEALRHDLRERIVDWTPDNYSITKLAAAPPRRPSSFWGSQSNSRLFAQSNLSVVLRELFHKFSNRSSERSGTSRGLPNQNFDSVAPWTRTLIWPGFCGKERY